MDKAIPWSWCCKGKSLSNEGVVMILLPQHFPGWIKRYIWVYFSKENSVELSLGGSFLVKFTRYFIVISFQGGIPRSNRPVYNLMIFHELDTLQLTQEKEKCSVAQCSTGCFKNNFLECKSLLLVKAINCTTKNSISLTKNSSHNWPVLSHEYGPCQSFLFQCILFCLFIF